MDENSASKIKQSGWFGKAGTQAVFKALNQEGYEARAVGGAVRNTLLDLPVADVDFAATAPPAEVIRLAGLAGIRAVPTGLDHGTVTLITDGSAHEVTTLRRDVTTDGRRAAVAFTAVWAEDAMRRDFTMNALYADAAATLHDPLGGLSDALERHVRFIGDARQRIREDFLRILRFFRFSAAYGEGKLDGEALLACIRERQGLRQLSCERIRTELLKILTANHAVAALQAMEDCGLLQQITAGVTFVRRFARLAEIETALSREPNPLLRLAALTVLIEEDAARIADRLRLSNAERKDLMGCAAHRLMPQRLHDNGVRQTLYRTGQRDYINALLLAWANAGRSKDDEAWRAFYEAGAAWQSPRFPLTGEDLVQAGFQPGPAIGTALKKLEDEWVARDFSLGKAQLLALARQISS